MRPLAISGPKAAITTPKEGAATQDDPDEEIPLMQPVHQQEASQHGTTEQPEGSTIGEQLVGPAQRQE